MECSYQRLTFEDIEMALEMKETFREEIVSKNGLQVFLKDSKNWLFTAISEGKIIGFSYGYELNRMDGMNNMLYIHEVGVAKPYWRQGVGYIMMMALKEECRKKQISKFFLSCSQNNVGANALYRKLGGEVASESKGNDANYWFRTK